MMFVNRTKEPIFLTNNKKEWTTNYLKTNNWRKDWYGYHGDLLNELKFITNYHCAFCDDVLTPVGSSKGQIEHFKPKVKFKCHSYLWLNLFPCCEICNQAKGDKFDNLLLRPDAIDFEFNKWFVINYLTFEISANKLVNKKWQRAEKTIEIYGLNNKDKIDRRRYVYYNTLNFVNNQPFRFMF